MSHARNDIVTMENHVVANAQELKAVLQKFDQDALFRGQVRQFGTDAAPKMNTSFTRNGCIPPLMLRWAHYSGFILSALLGTERRNVSLEFTQAILQHYGWRSFYLDASSDPGVSAWFAAHSFKGGRSIELCEDCFEDGVFLVKLRASYSFEDGDGFLYVISKKAMKDRGLTLVDLSSIEMTDCRPRFHAQKAWLIGPLNADLPTECIVASIRGPRGVFREFAHEQGLTETQTLFPDKDEDPVLELLTSMPWKRMESPKGGPRDLRFFAQPFEFPEYHDSFRKHNPPHVAFYEGDSSFAALMPDAEVAVFSAPEVIVYGYADPLGEKFPMVAELLEGEGRHFVFEIDNLVRRPGLLSTDYLKGLAITKIEPSLVSVADFAVDHPGLQMAGCGINMGWHYRIGEDGVWTREEKPDDCPCGNKSIHEHHLSMLTILEDQIIMHPESVRRQEKKASPNATD